MTLGVPKVARVLAATLACSAAAACAGTSRDVVPETREVHLAPGEDAGPRPIAKDDYVYIARRPHGAVGLAEARGIADDVAKGAIDHLANELETCATKLAAEGKLARDGAGRVVAQIAADGSVAALNVNAPPGALVASNLLVCLVSPLRLVTFPPAPDAGARGIAIEATWGNVP